jgi:radical SAM enzyme (TIGR01210 family)
MKHAKLTNRSKVMRAFEYEKKFYRKGQNAIAWMGLDLFDGERIRSLTIILRTKGCYWARSKGCTMCGYIYDADPSLSDKDIKKQFDAVLHRYGKNFGVIKLFTSGSFLDVDEVSTDVRNYILNALSDVPKVIVETRPEFVTDEICEEISKMLNRAEVAIGLETSNDLIRNNCINKGFAFSDFVKASKTASSHDITIKAYLLLKPPFLTEREALDDAVTSIKDTTRYADTISLNLCNVQKGTYVEELWKKRLYRPPWLWTAAEVLKRTAGITTIICDPVAAGTPRGPHNCGKCDDQVVREIREYSFTQDEAVFNANCNDKKAWEFVLKFERFTYGAPLVF